MHLNLFATATGYYVSSWRLPESDPSQFLTLDYFVEVAQRCEAAKLDAVFFADAPALAEHLLVLCPWDALAMISTLIGFTKQIGLVATVSTTFNEPFNLARRLATLDHLSGGRVGWNIVTSYHRAEMENFGLDGVLSHAERYARAEEFLQVVKALWDSWDEDALLLDKDSGRLFDPDRIHPLDHAGEHYRVRGPLSIPRGPQGRPVLVQAGSSEDGVAFAARHAEAIFTAQTDLETSVSFRNRLRDLSTRAGRDPETVKILPGLFPVMGETDAEARARLEELVAVADPKVGIKVISNLFDRDFSQLPLDGPIPDLSTYRTEANQSRAAVYYETAVRENLETLGDWARRMALGSGHLLLIGGYESVADEMERWFVEGACDGFNVQIPVSPGDLRRFLDGVVPRLQQRGVFRREYSGTTLRSHLGLPRPPVERATAARDAIA
jgi:FMN-dependent oxidoreductase (nitrilotriacetate monooxygenase family)